jgi:NitT/TauT family transport system substrate-binding protein
MEAGIIPGRRRRLAETFRIVNEDTVFTLPWEVAIQEGLFRAAGFEVEVPEKNPGNTALGLFDRNKEVLFESGQVDCFNVCEWGAIKRTAVEGRTRPGMILGFRESVTVMGIVARRDSGITRPDELAGVPVAVQEHTGSHYMAIHMMEGFVPKDEIQTVHVGGPLARLRALLDGQVQAAALMEPFLSFAEKSGWLITMAYYNGLVVAPDDYDQGKFERLQKIVEQAVDLINADPAKYAPLLLNDLPSDLRGQMSMDDLHLDRLRYVYARPYTQREYERAAQWMVEWGLLEEGIPSRKAGRRPIGSGLARSTRIESRD